MGCQHNITAVRKEIPAETAEEKAGIFVPHDNQIEAEAAQSEVTNKEDQTQAA